MDFRLTNPPGPDGSNGSLFGSAVILWQPLFFAP